MSTYYLVAARAEKDSDPAILDEVIESLSAKKLKPCLWMFEGEERGVRVLRLFHHKLGFSFEYILIRWPKNKNDDLWKYAKAWPLDIQIETLSDEGKLNADSLLSLAVNTLSLQEASLG